MKFTLPKDPRPRILGSSVTGHEPEVRLDEVLAAGMDLLPAIVVNLLDFAAIHEFLHHFEGLNDRQIDRAIRQLGFRWEVEPIIDLLVWDFEKTLDQIFEAEDAEDRWQPTLGEYHPSALCLPCLRSAYFKHAKPKKAPREKKPIFKIGDLIHDWAEQGLSLDGTIDVLEVEKAHTLSIRNIDWHCRIDALIRIKEENLIAVVDFKTTSPGAFHRRLKENVPQEHHLLQLMVYLRALDVGTGFIVYINKSSGETKTFKVYYDPLMYRVMADRAEALHHYLVSEKLPPRVESRDAWQCDGYCDHVEECKEAGKQ